MIFSPLNLINQLTLSQSVRIMVQSVVASATPDHNAIETAINLALADLDIADPLILQRSVDLTAVAGQDSPIVRITSHYLGTQVIACYLGDQTEANQISFDLVDERNAQLHAYIDQPVLRTLIRWPRRSGTIPLSDLPPGVPSFSSVRCVIAASPMTLFNTDGVPVKVGDRVLAAFNLPGAASGIQLATSTGYVRATDNDELSELAVGKVVCVTEGVKFADTVWQIADPLPLLATGTIIFKQMFYDSNIDSDQAHAIIVPRAAAYAALAVTASLDKATAAQVTAWSNAILARPIPSSRDAFSHHLISATRYSNA
ncbi:MAG TPA: hypothetical protein VGK81_05980 [Anaerolineae bacterium]|jgi:hypothetical protein